VQAQHVSRKRRHGRASLREPRDVTALRQIDQQDVRFAFGSVVGPQAVAEPACLDPHDRIGRRIERRRPAECLHRDHDFFDLRGAAREDTLDDEARNVRARSAPAKAGLAPYDAGKRATMVFDDVSAVAEDPIGAERTVMFEALYPS